MKLKETIATLVDYYAHPENHVTGPFVRNYNTVQASIKNLEQLLLELGCEHLGSGNFSEVHCYGGKRAVIKITRNGDSGYESYAAFAMKHQHNPHVPRIYYHRKLDDNGAMLYVLEKLQPYHEPGQLNEASKDFNNLVSVLEALGSHYNRSTLPSSFTTGHQHLDEFLRSNLDFDDMGSRNQMVRPDGTLVITDPCC